MIAIQKIGKSFMGALGYNLKKMQHPDKRLRAELLNTNFTSTDPRQIKKEVEWVKSLKPNLNRYVYHNSINFPKEEQLDSRLLVAIANDYLQKSGFTNNQYFIFRHHDAGHPHLHLLVNRIGFDGSVVSDSNNYKKSEAILRELEYQYNLIPVEQSKPVTLEQSSFIGGEEHIQIPDEPNNKSTIKQGNAKTNEQSFYVKPGQYNHRAGKRDNGVAVERTNKVSANQPKTVSQRAPTKDELEMVVRTGKPSEKMLLQELMNRMLSQKLTLQQMIITGEQVGIQFLFNQASTGLVTGITYFHEGFKIKGQALGNRFKWAELIKSINYEQVRDREAISAANSRTKSIYGESQPAAGIATGSRNRPGVSLVHENPERNTPGHITPEKASADDGGKHRADKNETRETIQDADALDNGFDSDEHSLSIDNIGVQIGDDVDDEAIHGRNRHRQRKARTNRR